MLSTPGNIRSLSLLLVNFDLMYSVVHDFETMTVFLFELFGFDITPLFMLFHSQHNHVIGLGPWVTGDPLQGLPKQGRILLVTRDNEALNHVCDQRLSLLLRVHDLSSSSIGLKGPFENDHHVYVQIHHLENCEHPGDEAVVLVVDGEEDGADEDKCPVDYVDGGDHKFVLLVALKVVDVHSTPVIYSNIIL